MRRGRSGDGPGNCCAESDGVVDVYVASKGTDDGIFVGVLNDRASVWCIAWCEFDRFCRAAAEDTDSIKPPLGDGCDSPIGSCCMESDGSVCVKVVSIIFDGGPYFCALDGIA